MTRVNGEYWLDGLSCGLQVLVYEVSDRWEEAEESHAGAAAGWFGHDVEGLHRVD